MASIASVKVDMSGLKRLQGELDPRARMVIAKTAFDVERFTKESITDQGAVDTGAYRASVYTSVGGGDSNYAAAVSKAAMLNPDAQFTPEAKADDMSANIGASVEYAQHLEFGTKKMGARPSLIPSLERVRKTFLAAWKELTK